MQAFVPKVRKPRFELFLKIHDLNNVPLVSGTCSIKWHVASSASAEHRGHTPKSIIKEHKVSWDYEKNFSIRLTVDRNQLLQECDLCFEILQEYHASGSRGERITLGHVKLNLAEYVDAQADGDGYGEDGGITRRYLMQESKINSTLKISVSMKQVEGDRNFIAPPLKTAPVFGGIAGIVSTEQAEHDDVGHFPSMNKPRDASDQADTYRRTLAASWASQQGELPADACIENIFAGGTGWRSEPQKPSKAPEDSGEASEKESGGRNSSSRRHRREKSVEKARNVEVTHGPEFRAIEVDEFDVRDDLRSWSLRAST
ncbi:MAG: hypothetical protein M4579_003102 [Chaenotheca gracillima]|nr:MAG: hypothetical protein M4579_003102 [Chaenotheca gracillima]